MIRLRRVPRPRDGLSFVLALALSAAGYAAEEGAPAADAISSATSALRSLKTNQALPGANAQALPTIEPSAIIIPSATTPAPLALPDARRDPAAAAKAVQSGKGWLLEAMTKDAAPAVGSVTGSLGALTLPDALFSPPAIPVADSVSAWLPPGEFSISSGPTDRSAGGSTGAGAVFGGDLGTSILPAAAPRIAPVVQMDPRDNPFVQAMNVPTASQRAPVVAPALPDTPIYRPPANPAPAPVQSRTENPLQNDKRADDQKYFPQLNRF